MEKLEPHLNKKDKEKYLLIILIWTLGNYFEIIVDYKKKKRNTIYYIFEKNMHSPNPPPRAGCDSWFEFRVFFLLYWLPNQS